MYVFLLSIPKSFSLAATAARDLRFLFSVLPATRAKSDKGHISRAQIHCHRRKINKIYHRLGQVIANKSYVLRISKNEPILSPISPNCGNPSTDSQRTRFPRKYASPLFKPNVSRLGSSWKGFYEENSAHHFSGDQTVAPMRKKLRDKFSFEWNTRALTSTFFRFSPKLSIERRMDGRCFQ